MQVAVSMWSLHREAQAGRIDTAGFVGWAADEGFAGVELLNLFWRDPGREVPEVRRLCEGLGVHVAAYDATNDFGILEPKARRAQLEQVRRDIDTAVSLGAPVLRVFAGGEHAKVRYEDVKRTIEESLAEVAAYAAQAGVVLALENHPGPAGRIRNMLDAIRFVNLAHMRVNLDPANFLLCDEDPREAAAQLADVVAHVHVKDLASLPGSAGATEEGTLLRSLAGRAYKGVVVGGGDVPWASVLGSLHARSYRGWLSIEYEGEGDARAGVIESRANLLAILRSL
ncbi:MAG: sugar phosphate isomerase/epimerase family protein [Bacillota bacterium]